MKKPTLLFPGSFMNYRKIDEDMLEEYRNAEKTGLFNYDEWLQGDRLKLYSTDYTSEQAVYRGWMLKPEEYLKLYSELSGMGIMLLTKPSEYKNMHLYQTDHGRSSRLAMEAYRGFLRDRMRRHITGRCIGRCVQERIVNIKNR